MGTDLPAAVPALLAAMKQVPAFACSFGLIAMFWYVHNTWSRRYGLDDGMTILLSLALVFLVLVYVYPLRMLFGSFFAWITALLLPAAWTVPFPFAVSSYDDIRVMFVVYAVAWATMGAIIVLLYRHAWRQRERLGLSWHERLQTRREAVQWSLVPITGAISIVVAYTVPDVERPWTLAHARCRLRTDVADLAGRSLVCAARAPRTGAGGRAGLTPACVAAIGDNPTFGTRTRRARVLGCHP